MFEQPGPDICALWRCAESTAWWDKVIMEILFQWFIQKVVSMYIEPFQKRLAISDNMIHNHFSHR